jgi:hypothetical protein
MKTQTDFAGSQFPDDEGGYGSRNVGLFTIKLFNAADSSGTFCPLPISFSDSEAD